MWACLDGFAINLFFMFVVFLHTSWSIVLFPQCAILGLRAVSPFGAGIDVIVYVYMFTFFPDIKPLSTHSSCL
jgi:hypothetical protein